MSQLQAIRYIGSYLLRQDWIGILITLVFALYVGGFMSLAVDHMLRAEEDPSGLVGFIDWIYLMAFPCFGMVMNRSAWVMWKDDFYTKRLAYFRTMPIPSSAIIQVRILQSTMMLVVLGSVCLTLQYILAPALRETVTVGQWMAAGFIWLGFSFIANAFYTYMELGYSGKNYAKVYLCVVVLTVIVVSVLTWQGIHLFQVVLQLAKSDFAVLWMILFATLAAAATWASYRFTLRRLPARSITF